jgi:aspartate aminotransferase-like enzyme
MEKTLIRAYRAAVRASEKATEARAALPPGASRARVTTANARWMRHAEARDHLRRELEALGVDVRAIDEDIAHRAFVRQMAPNAYGELA